nr:hypothetical protein [Tanacetum cinerariifolium]
MVSSSAVEEHVDATLNKEDVNVGQTPASPNVNPKPGTSYANLFTTGSSRKAMNFRTLFTLGGNEVDVVVLVESIRAINARFVNYDPDVNLLKEDVGNVPVWADVELKDTIVVAMYKLYREGFYTCKEECPKNPGLGVVKNLKKPSRGPRGVPVGLKVGFKQTKEYRPVSKKPTAATSGNKKKGVESTKENVKTSSTSTTPIVDKIGKLKKLIIDGKVTLMDDDGKPLKKVDYPGDHDSEDEVESVDNDMTRSMAS